IRDFHVTGVQTCALPICPVLVPPVKEIFFTSGCCTMALPTTEPLPGNTLSKPGGSPACSNRRASSKAIKDVASAGFKITALPAAKAGGSFCTSEAMGEFQGVMAATTPKGACTLMVNHSLDRALVSSVSRVSRHAAV